MIRYTMTMYSKLVTIFIVSWIIIWGGFFGWLAISSKSIDLDQMATTQYPTHGTDSEQYTILAENLQQHGVFSLNTEPPFVPDGFRTIGYPLFLATVKSIFQTFYVAVVLQMFLVLVSAYLIWRIAQKLNLEKWSFLPPLIFLADPAVLFYSLFLLSDTLFNFLLVCSVWFFVKAIQEKNQKQELLNFSLTGLWVGLAVLVRPIAIFLPSVFIFAYILLRFPFSLKKIMLEMAVLLGCLGLVVAPWLIRNQLTFHTWQLSSVGPVTFFEFTVPEFIEQNGGLKVAETREQFHEELNVITNDLVIDMRKTGDMMKIVKRELRGRWGEYILFHLQKTTPFVYTSSAKIFIVGTEPLRSNATLWQMTSYPTTVSGIATPTWLEFKIRAVQAIFLLERLIWFTLFLLATLSPFLVKTKEKRFAALVCCAFMAYFALLTGPVANERYRLPAVPFLGISLALVLSDRLGKLFKLDLLDKM